MKNFSSKNKVMKKLGKERKRYILLALKQGNFDHAQKVLSESKDVLNLRLYRKLEREIELCFKFKDSKRIMKYVYFSLIASIVNFFLWIWLWIIFYDFMGYYSTINIIVKLLSLSIAVFFDQLIRHYIKSRMGLWNYWNNFTDYQLLILIGIIFITIRDFFWRLR